MEEDQEEMQMINEPVPQIKDAPISTSVESTNEKVVEETPEEDVPVVEEVEEVTEETPAPEEAPSEDAAKEDSPAVEEGVMSKEEAGEHIVSFGKYKNNPTSVKEICEKDAEWVKKCLSITSPTASIKPDIDALNAYCK